MQIILRDGLFMAIASPGWRKRRRPTPSHRRKTSFFKRRFRTFSDITGQSITHFVTYAKSVKS